MRPNRLLLAIWDEDWVDLIFLRSNPNTTQIKTTNMEKKRNNK